MMDVMTETKPLSIVDQAQFLEARLHFPEWLNELRSLAYHRFLEMGFPTKKSESWKYTDLTGLLKSVFKPMTMVSDRPSTAQSALSQAQAYRVVVADGRFFPDLGVQDVLPEGLSLTPFSALTEVEGEALRSALEAVALEETNPFALVNMFQFRDGLRIHVSEGVTLPHPIHIVVTCEGEGALQVQPRIHLTVEENAKAEVVVSFEKGALEKSFVNSVLSVEIGKGASVYYSSVNLCSSEETLIDTVRLRQEAASHFYGSWFVEEGVLTKSDVRADLVGEKAHTSLSGLSVLTGQSQSFSEVVVRHEVPECTSSQFYKSILCDRSKSEYNGLVYVHPKAQKTDSVQSNKNLLLSDEARVYARPQLRIYADDVLCAHGSTTGQLDEEEIFYLRTRGLSDQKARSVLMRGFVEEVIEKVHTPFVRAHLERVLMAKLDRLVKT